MSGDAETSAPDRFWRHNFDFVRDVRDRPITDYYDVVIPANGLLERPHLGPGLKVALLCTEIDALERFLTLGLDGDLLFRPSAVARLDRHRECRKTLVTTRILFLGDLISESDLGEEKGGPGISAELKSTVLGRCVLYDLAKGTSLDFGMFGARAEALK